MSTSSRSGRGSKVCPKTDVEALQTPHLSATRADLEARLCQDLGVRKEASSPECDVFRKTAALISAIRKLGCGAPEYEETNMSLGEKAYHESEQSWIVKTQRGYKSSERKCEGRISLEYHNDEHGHCKIYLRSDTIPIYIDCCGSTIFDP